MATILSPSTWVQALPMRLKRLFETQQPSPSGSDKVPTSKNPTEDAANHDDEWGDWVIPTPECEEQVEYAAPLFKEPGEDENIIFKITLEEFLARQQAMARNAQQVVVGNKELKPVDGETEEDSFRLEEIPIGTRMPCNTPDGSDAIENLGPCLVDLDACGW